MTTHPRTKPMQITRTFPGTEPPDNTRDVYVELASGNCWIGCYLNGGWSGLFEPVRRWAELPTFPKQKGKKK